MNLFTIYNLQTGEIEYSTATYAEADEVGLLDCQGIIGGSYQPNEYKVVNGQAVIRNDNALEITRMKRNALLKESDWTQMPDGPLTESQRAEWASYRQALRDITQNDPVVWPTPPVI